MNFIVDHPEKDHTRKHYCTLVSLTAQEIKVTARSKKGPFAGRVRESEVTVNRSTDFAALRSHDSLLLNAPEPEAMGSCWRWNLPAVHQTPPLEEGQLTDWLVFERREEIASHDLHDVGNISK